MKKFGFRALSVLLMACIICMVVLAGCAQKDESLFEMVEYSQIDKVERLEAYMQADGGFSSGPDFESPGLYDTYYSGLISQAIFPEYAHVYGERNVPIELQNMDLSTASLPDCWYYTKLFLPYLTAHKDKVEQLRDNPNVKKALQAQNIDAVLEIFFAIDICKQLDIQSDTTAAREFLVEYVNEMNFSEEQNPQSRNELLSAYSGIVNLVQINELLETKIETPDEKILRHWGAYTEVIRESMVDGTLDIFTLNNYIFLAKEFNLELQISNPEIEIFIKSLQGNSGEYNVTAKGWGDAFSSYLCAEIITNHDLAIDLKPMKKLLMKFEMPNGTFAPYVGRESTPSNSYYALLSLKQMKCESVDADIKKYLDSTNFASITEMGSLAYELQLKNAVGATYTNDQLNEALLQLHKQSEGNMSVEHTAENLLYLLNITIDLRNDTAIIREGTADKIKQMLYDENMVESPTIACLKNAALKKLNLEHDVKIVKDITKTIENYVNGKDVRFEKLLYLIYCAKSCGIDLKSGGIKQQIAKVRDECYNDFGLYSENKNGKMTMKSIYIGLYMESNV